MDSQQYSERDAAAAELKNVVEKEKTSPPPVSLDDLIELLDADDLRNVVEMVRPKGSGAR